MISSTLLFALLWLMFVLGVLAAVVEALCRYYLLIKAMDEDEENDP